MDIGFHDRPVEAQLTTMRDLGRTGEPHDVLRMGLLHDHREA